MTISPIVFRRPARSCSPLTRQNLIVYAVLLLLAWGGASAGPRADAQSSDPLRQLLQVRQADDGRWIGWVIIRNRRTMVNVPQTEEEIIDFAEHHNIDLKWHNNPLADRPPDLLQTSGEQPDNEPADIDALDDEREMENPSHETEQSAPASVPVAMPESVDGKNLSLAEQSTRLKRIIAAEVQRLEEFRAELFNPEGEYQRAEAAFKAAEQELAAQQGKIADLKQADEPEERQASEEALKAIANKHELAKQRFDLAIQTRKTVQEQMTALEEKLRHDQLALDKLTGVAPPPAAAEPQATASPTTESAMPPTIPPANSAPNADAPPTVAAENAPPLTPAAIATAAVTEEVPPAAPAPEKVSVKLLEAQQRAEQKKEEAHAAELEAQSIGERIASLEKTIGLEQKLFEAARKKADIAYQQQRVASTQYQDKADAGAPRAQLIELAKQRKEAAANFDKARGEVAARTDHLNRLQAERTALLAEELTALKDAEQKKGEAAHAENEVVTLKNPFSMHNMLQWLLDHGVKISLILVSIGVLRMLLKVSTKRFVVLMIKSGARGTPEEREDRASTLVGVFHNAGSLAIIVGGVLMICDEVGVAVGPLMGGAAVVGLAVAFGAQNLIRDYFYGFVILLENQYKINDILKIGDVAGQVERITLRMTVLRDLEGRVHFIPNGKIDSVTNMTHGWSRAVFDIGVAYKEDADKVMKVLMELAHDLRNDATIGPMIIDNPEMLGVDAFGDSAVVIKFVIKTRPLKQWAVKRELLRRIKRRFDELGIEIPFPHRTVYHHHSDAEPKLESDGEYGHRAA